MSTYLSSILTTTQRFRQLLPAGESDGDTTDDTHICRVLRAYYTEKGRAFPSWLPPDPKSAPPAALPRNNNYGGGNYGGMGAPGGQSKLSSLWDKPAEVTSLPQKPQSLRQVGAGGGGRGPRRDVRGGTSSEESAPPPLPSQREGSYQNSSAPPQGQVSRKFLGAKSGGNSLAPSASGSGLRPPGTYERQESYESGRQDRLDRPSASQPWSSGGGYSSAQDPSRQQRGYR